MRDDIKRLNKRIKEEILILPVRQCTKDSLEKAIFGSLSFYTYLPLDILDTTKDRECYLAKTIDLSLYAILYVASVVFTDKLFDHQMNIKSHKLFVEYNFFIKEYAVRGLQETIGSESKFWMSFDALKYKLFANSSFTNHDFNGGEEELFIKLLNKSSLIGAYISAMQIIVQEELEWDKILDTLNKFHKAFQLVDDYEDLIEDAKNDQLNYYLYVGKQCMLESETISNNIKVLYVDGVIERGLNCALLFSKESAEDFSRLNMRYSHAFSKELYQQIGRILVEIRFLKQKAIVKSELSNRKITNNTISLSISKSLAFIKNRRNDNNSWTDFMTLAGPGTNWITAFVISMLGEFPENREYLKESLDWLEKQEGNYNDGVVVDADSTNFLIKAKSVMENEVHKADIEKWEQFVHPSGGFSTYRDNSITRVLHISPDSNIIGWTAEHYCVTAVACWIAKSIKCGSIYEKALSYLRDGIRSDGSIPSYWWTEDLYTTAFAVMCGLYGKPVEYILKRQVSKGYWTNMDKPSVFYTSLCIKALELIPNADSNIRSCIERGVDWIVSQQNDDGSWDSEEILRIPAPDILDPQSVNNWKRSSFGVNIITDDYGRVFTTALTYNILLSYNRYVA